MNTLQKILLSLGWISIIGAIGLIVTLFTWYNYPYKIVEFSTPIIPVESPIVQRGKYLIIRSQYRKYINIQPMVTIQFIDGIVNVTPSVKGGTGIGYYNHQTYIKVPEELPTTTYKIRIIYEYKVNPIRTITIIRESQLFEVVR